MPKPAAPKHEFHQPFQRDLGRPDCAAKINRFAFPPNQLHLRAIPPHRRGTYASSRYVECGERWTRGARAREVLQGGLRLRLGAREQSIRAGRAAQFAYGKSVWFWHPWLVSSWRRLNESNRVRSAANPAATEAKGIRLREERAIIRQTIAQGRPDALRWTCMLVCALLCAIAHETAGAARTRSSLRPPLGESFGQTSGELRREIANAYSVVIGRLDRAIQYSRGGSD